MVHGSFLPPGAPVRGEHVVARLQEGLQQGKKKEKQGRGSHARGYAPAWPQSQ